MGIDRRCATIPSMPTCIAPSIALSPIRPRRRQSAINARNASSAAAAPRYAPAKKSLAQNFLVDRRIASRIIASADIRPDDRVLEIGPGRGMLTRLLATPAAAELTAIELDADLAAALSARIRRPPEYPRHPRRRARNRRRRNLPAARALQACGEPALLRRAAHHPPLSRGCTTSPR